MKTIDKNFIKKVKTPDKFSHKGQNGKLLIVGGSSLFHGASLWALKIASRVVDMVFYLSTDKNQQYTDHLNRELYDFINIKFADLDSYVREADAVLIGPGMVRDNDQLPNFSDQTNTKFKLSKKYFEDTRKVVKQLLDKYPDKKWVIDAGALQVMAAGWLKKLPKVIITPHRSEFVNLFNNKSKLANNTNVSHTVKTVNQIARDYSCTVVLKGPVDIICSPQECMVNKTGNEGMTKGGTGDVLAGLVGALACQNDLFTAAAAGAYFTGLAGDELKQQFGVFYNASDLCDQIPKTLHRQFQI